MCWPEHYFNHVEVNSKLRPLAMPSMNFAMEFSNNYLPIMCIYVAQCWSLMIGIHMYVASIIMYVIIILISTKTQAPCNEETIKEITDIKTR
jgi:hypothetical protein